MLGSRDTFASVRKIDDLAEEEYEYVVVAESEE